MLRVEKQPKRNFVLLDDEKELGRLIYPKWWHPRAEILLPEGIYDVTRKSFWSMGLTAKLQEIPIIHVRFPWRGGGKLERPGRPDKMLTYKLTSFWKSRYVVTDAENIERLVLRAKVAWFEMDREHVIEKSADPPLEALEILMIIHALNVSHRRAAATGAS